MATQACTYSVDALIGARGGAMRALSSAEARIVECWVREVEHGARNLAGKLGPKLKQSAAHNLSVQNLAELGLVVLRGRYGYFVAAIDVEACRAALRDRREGAEHAAESGVA